jgi:hypothetical protein
MLIVGCFVILEICGCRAMFIGEVVTRKGPGAMT